jgi:hypothetical protein
MTNTTPSLDDEITKKTQKKNLIYVKNHLFILKDEKKGVEWVILGQK